MLQRNRKIFIFFIFCIIILCFLCFLLSRDMDKRIKENPYIPQIDRYTVTEYQGKIAVFKNSDTVPIDVYDTYVSVLPQHDRELLENGIHTESTSELQKIIEDYTS